MPSDQVWRAPRYTRDLRFDQDSCRYLQIVRQSGPSVPVTHPGSALPAWSQARRLGPEAGPQRGPEWPLGVRQAILGVIPPEVSADVVREPDVEAVVVADQRPGGGEGARPHRTSQADLTEAEQCMRVQHMELPEVTPEGPGTGPDPMTVSFVVRKEDVSQPVTDSSRHVSAGESERAQLVLPVSAPGVVVESERGPP